MSSINVTDWKFPRLWRSLAFLCKEGRNAIGFRHPSVFSIKKSPVQSEVGPLSPWKARIASKPLFLLVHFFFSWSNPYFWWLNRFFHGQIPRFWGIPISWIRAYDWSHFCWHTLVTEKTRAGGTLYTPSWVQLSLFCSEDRRFVTPNPCLPAKSLHMIENIQFRRSIIRLE